MRVALITITGCGLAVGNRVIDAFGDAVMDLFLPKKFEGQSTAANIYTESLSALTSRIFNKYDGIVYIMAMGIVLRVIAPNIKDKYSDPAVVVIDDVGRYVISALSGHEGGANRLSLKIAGILHTDAVITTGSESVKDVIIGIGCKRGVLADDIKLAIEKSLRDVNIPIDRVRLLSTIDLKANEPGLVSASQELDIPLRIVSREEIASCLIEYKESEFVKKSIGVGAVCEPAAILGGRKTKLILTKQKFAGITIAIAVENFTW